MSNGILDLLATKNVGNLNPETDETEGDEAEDKLLTDIATLGPVGKTQMGYGTKWA